MSTAQWSLVVSVALAVLTLSGALVFLGRLRERLDNIEKRSLSNGGRLDAVEGKDAAGAVLAADVAARLLQVERIAESLRGMNDRLVRVETAAEIHHTATTKALEHLDRSTSNVARQIANMAAGKRGASLMDLGAEQ